MNYEGINVAERSSLALVYGIPGNGDVETKQLLKINVVLKRRRAQAEASYVCLDAHNIR